MVRLLVALGLLGFAAARAGACESTGVAVGAADEPSPFVVVLGVAQDGGYPQAACRRACCRVAWEDESRRRFVSCLAIVDPASGQRWLIDATPDFAEQVRLLDEIAPPDADKPGAASQAMLDGVLLTHAHVGHYTGLQDLGREVTGAAGVPVYAMPRMAEFLASSGPWSQLVSLGNIEVRALADGEAIALNERISVTPLLVPHRDEFSETVGFRIDGPGARVLFIPDIDKWERWDEWDAAGAGASRLIEDEIRACDVAYLDATFFSGDELGGRDMSQIPHPSVRESLARFGLLPADERAKVRFIHLNHTNPLLRGEVAAVGEVEAAGMRVAEQGERAGL
ncbi:MAG: MBL fold metallo-hydrolase [Phycisphaerales bacterium]